MWSLHALAALAAALAVNVECIEYCAPMVEPLNKTMVRLEMNGSRSWHEVDSMCNEQFPGGFEMLKRDFLGLSEADRALCRGQAVPLGLHEMIGSERIIWGVTNYQELQEDVNSTYLAHRRDATSPNETAHEQVGSLDLTTNQWRLVDNDTSFSCAICQRAWINGLYKLNVDPPPRRAPFQHAFGFRLVKTGTDNVTDDEVRDRVVDLLKSAADESDDPEARPFHVEAEIEKTVDDWDGQEGVLLRLRGSYPMWLLSFHDLRETLENASYAIESVQDVDMCPTSRLDGVEWTLAWGGKVSPSFLPGAQLVSKQCVIRMRGDGDYDAVWDKKVFHWVDRQRECRTRKDSDVYRFVIFSAF